MRHVMYMFVRLIWGSYVRRPARFKAFLRPLWIDGGHRRGKRGRDELYENSSSGDPSSFLPFVVGQRCREWGKHDILLKGRARVKGTDLVLHCGRDELKVRHMISTFLERHVQTLKTHMLTDHVSRTVLRHRGEVQRCTWLG